MQIRFDQGPLGAGTWFGDPIRVIEAWEPADVPGAFDAIEAAQGEGLWVAGYGTYELGYALEERLLPLMPAERRLPLLRFGVYQAPSIRPLRHGSTSLTEPCPLWTQARYEEVFDQVKAYIGAGDTYQINWNAPHAWFDFGTVQFVLDNNLEVIGIEFDAPNYDIFFDEIHAVPCHAI